MTYIITSLCLRDSGCVDVCPVECIVPGKPVEEWPWYYIDPDTCIDCGACIPECPFEAIFVEDEVPDAYEAKGGEQVSMPMGTAGHEEVFDGNDHHGEPVHLEGVRTLEAGESLDLTPDIQPNYDYFQSGPGYSALD
ncbi:MAG: ferredoxin family protein [Anaerolineales bacterium]|nr:ferredoxin family protein [Anaerolineales bacterium]